MINIDCIGIIEKVREGEREREERKRREKERGERERCKGWIKRLAKIGME